MILIPPRTPILDLTKDLQWDLTDEDELHENVEPELSRTINEEFDNAPWNPQAQLQAQLHAGKKARSELPRSNLSKAPLVLAWFRPFEV